MPTTTTNPANAAIATPDDAAPILSSEPGPGALSTNNGNWLSNIGQTMMNMAPWLAGISDAGKAAALQKIAVASQQPNTGGTWNTSPVDPKTGIAIQTNTLTGNTKKLQVHAPQPDERKWGIIGKDRYGQPTYGYPPNQDDFNPNRLQRE